MEPSKDAITVRLNRLNDQLFKISFKSIQDPVQITKETLLDALQVLYDECNADYLKKIDPNITKFIEKYTKAMVELRRTRINISDFEVKAVIGRGQFGDVHVVREKQTGDIYAMKTIRKSDSVTFEEEKSIMALTHSPWITALQYAFQDCNSLYFVMDYHPGGDLLGLIYRQGGTIPETAATFYISELILALNDLHKMGYVHRDIKPDNVLLDRCGHLKLADFGSAAKLNSKGLVTDGLPIGTPDYIAPEVLQSMDNKNNKKKDSYGIACDFWSLGILAYELIVGNTPFSAQNTAATYSKIMAYTNNLRFPSDIVLSQGYTQLIRQLLRTNPSDRPNHATLLNHPAFKHMDFSGLLHQVPPYVPRIASADDISNFSDMQQPAQQQQLQQRAQKNVNIENFKRKTQFSGRHLPFLGFTYANMPEYEARQAYCGGGGLKRVPSVVKVKDELVESLKKEINALKKKQLKDDTNSNVEAKMDSLERKLEDKSRKLESVETVRDRLERDLANVISESTALKRTLEFERKDRSELELKALDIIKSTKTKWEASEKIKIEAFNIEIESLKECIDKLRLDNAQMNQELQKTIHAKKEQKKSIEHVEKLRRSSVVGLENRLEKVTSDTQRKICTLQSELSAIAHEKLQLEKDIVSHKKTDSALNEKILDLVKQVADAKSQSDETRLVIKDFEHNVFNLRTDNNSLKKIVEDQRQQIGVLTDNKKQETDDCVQKQIDANDELKETIKRLKLDLSSARSTHQQLVKRYDLEIEQLRATLATQRLEHDQLRVDLRAANDNDETNRVKVRQLEELLARLESGVSRLEHGSNGEQVLQEQVQRLEQQSVEVHETLALEKHEHLQLKSKFWRLEKDLSNAELDRKIIERDLKESQTKVNTLTKEIDTLDRQISTIEKQNENNISTATSDHRKLQQEIGNLQISLRQNEDELHMEKMTSQDQKMRIDILRNDIQAKDLMIAELSTDLNEAKASSNDLEKVMEVVKKEMATIEEKTELYKKYQLESNNDVEKLRQELENSTLNRGALRDACTILEEQLTEFERIYTSSEAKRIALTEQLAEARAASALATDQVQDGKRAVNEEKSLRHLAETRVKRAEEEVATLQGECEAQRADVAEYKRYACELTEELGRTEAKLAECECTLREYERQMESFVSECNGLKEENSQQRTTLCNVKESGYKLGHDLLEMQANAKVQAVRIKELEYLLNEKIGYYQERELKSQATIQQQTKLIDFLQSKVEDSKKKKTLSDKLFGHSRKENTAPSTVPLNYRDLEAQLTRERDQTQRLRSELVQLRSKVNADKAVSYGTDALLDLDGRSKVLEQIVNSPASQKNDLFRQNSVQRMHHNIPHRFESKLCTRHMKCAQCSNPIQLGRNYSNCRACCTTAHTNCAAGLPRTCGLPSGFIKHYNDSLARASGQAKVKEVETLNQADISVEGWVKIPIRNSWEKHYACLTANQLHIYGAPPHEVNTAPVLNLHLLGPETRGKVALEPVASEIPAPVASSDLPFVLKVDVAPLTTCWPGAESLVFMALSVEDKDKWYNALDAIFKSAHPSPLLPGDVILKPPSSIEIHLITNLTSDSPTNHHRTHLLSTTSGLMASTSQLSDEPLLHIAGPTQVHDLTVLSATGLVLMVIDEKRTLCQCDVRHLASLMDCAPCTKPTLKFAHLPVVSNNELMLGFHTVRSGTTNPSSGHHEMACAATNSHIVLLTVDTPSRTLRPIRVLDTAEPTSCILFTELSLLIAADKLFEINLATLEPDEFLDERDPKLGAALTCHKLRSYPIAILEIEDRTEYLAAYNEFAVFVDEFGCGSREKEITWTHIPRHLHYARSYLYVVQFAAVEIIKVAPNDCDSLVRLDLDKPKFLGGTSSGIYVQTGGEVRFISGGSFDDAVSSLSDLQALKQCTDDVLNNSDDRFSFTSSMVQSLDGNLSVSEVNAQGKKVQFSTETDL